MIARRWHGRVPAAKADEYLTLSKEVGLADYRSTEGNRGAWCLHRREGDADNARYWYQRAGRPEASGTSEAEWTCIVQHLLD